MKNNSTSNLDRKSFFSITHNDLDSKNQISQKSYNRFPSQQQLYYYVEKQVGDNKVIPVYESLQNISTQIYDEDMNTKAKNRSQKIIYLQKDMIQYSPQKMKLKQTNQLLNNYLQKIPHIYEAKDKKQFQHFKNDNIHMPFANIFPNSNQKLSKLLGYEPVNQQQISMNQFRQAMEQRSIKALINKNQGNLITANKLKQTSKEVIQNFDSHFSNRLENSKKEQIQNLSIMKKFKEDFHPLRRSDIIYNQENKSKYQLYRNIFILHINHFKQSIVEALEYKIPFYNTTEQILKDNFSSNQQLLENLLEHCTQCFSLPYQLKYISLLDETPIQYLQDIPIDQNIIIISNNPKNNFWQKYYESKQVNKPSEKDFQTLLLKLNNLNDLNKIENFFKNKKSFITDLDDFSGRSSAMLINSMQQTKGSMNSIEQMNQSNDVNNNDQQKNINEFRQSAFEKFSIISQSENPTPNKQNCILINNLNSPSNYQYSRASFMSPLNKQPLQSPYKRLDSFATPQKFKNRQQLKSLPQIKESYNKYLKKENSRMRVIEQPKKLRENIIQTQQTQNQNEMEKQKLKAKFQQNIDKYTSLDLEMKKKYNLLSEAANVQEIISKTSFDRYQLHLLFSKFKALIHYKAKYRNPLKKSPKILIEEGVDVISFRRGVDSLLVAPNEQIEKIFQSQNAFVTKDQGGMNWEGFIYSLNMIEAKTDNAKIDLFMRLLDENQNGTISYDEIFDQSNQLLKQLLKNQNKGEISVDEISHFLTKTIFDAVGQDYDKEILSEDLKLQIRRKNKDLELLLMLCFYNNEQPNNYYSNSDEEELMEEEKKIKSLQN
ncbi:protein phosphatase 2C containing protein (macronuclear) [Tetrahymena thermophila SB210]|uniref:Protein phosphatase 2C containing protein n=1 Tax=Tetrahymena thermophila (strain SB210) TaxID=312017 RepID=I7MLY7_TETTS|nr:protein phosphatase 2C containing protein [Tetrahymena thermophila SB210]EAS03308.3 protein phosphatase 2C containing protein [Tetrahymena thermophila SB210]|eukprot:XP_001023553.3 protein phosphatase 2C containing protein [Tetrahymena thermophila SB210]